MSAYPTTVLWLESSIIDSIRAHVFLSPIPPLPPLPTTPSNADVVKALFEMLHGTPFIKFFFSVVSCIFRLIGIPHHQVDRIDPSSEFLGLTGFEELGLYTHQTYQPLEIGKFKDLGTTIIGFEKTAISKQYMNDGCSNIFHLEIAVRFVLRSYIECGGTIVGLSIVSCLSELKTKAKGVRYTISIVEELTFVKKVAESTRVILDLFTGTSDDCGKAKA
ncbi:unnamed protein product [Lactuca virosa]|uniref:Uncharacterized protein n=1 Tax=Lactuca virosa TaxID=75947 RepID=A0AAU9LBT9_9ASTR|nr:unnamed protein product [Lactuca virosa]